MKVLKIIVNLLLLSVFLLGAGCIVMLIIGIQPYVVISGSMEPEIATGSLCFIDKRVTYNQVSVGMIIAFSNSDGTMTTHRVSRKTPNGVITKGDANKVEDPTPVTSSNYIGRNVHYIPKIGFVLDKFRSGPGIVMAAVFLVILLFLGLVVNTPDKGKSGPTVMKY